MAGAVGRYELVRTIGRGGMAEVFLARRRGAAGIAKRLVVKRVRADLTSDPRFAEMFLREARVATALSHQNIVTVFDVGRDDEGLFLAMDYVDGPDLGAVIERAVEQARRIDPLVCAHIAAEVAAGLDYAHRLRDDTGAAVGLVHRDVTPRNVLLSLDGEVKVTDFGVAMVSSDAGAERRGTVPYMSPEAAAGEAVGARADLFSLGLVLHELLTGQRVYRGGNRDELLAMARAGAVPRLEGDVPRELADIVARACAVRPEDRHESARAMQRELASFAMAQGSEPPEHLLAGLLAELFPDWREKGGEDVGLRPVGVAGTQTMRSVAETVGASEVVPTPLPTGAPTPLPTPAPAPAPGAQASSRRLPVAIAAVAAVALTLGGVFAFRAMTGDEREEAPPPAPVVAKAPDPAPAPEPAPETEPEPAPTPETEPVHEDPKPERPTEKPKVVKTAETGLLDLNAVPWAYVSIDGGAEEETPIRGRKLSAGSHKVRIRNPVLERQRDMTIEISPGETSRYVVDLKQ